jgi:hypothetical protein
MSWKNAQIKNLATPSLYVSVGSTKTGCKTGPFCSGDHTAGLHFKMDCTFKSKAHMPNGYIVRIIATEGIEKKKYVIDLLFMFL